MYKIRHYMRYAVYYNKLRIMVDLIVVIFSTLITVYISISMGKLNNTYNLFGNIFIQLTLVISYLAMIYVFFRARKSALRDDMVFLRSIHFSKVQEFMALNIKLRFDHLFFIMILMSFSFGMKMNTYQITLLIISYIFSSSVGMSSNDLISFQSFRKIINKTQAKLLTPPLIRICEKYKWALLIKDFSMITSLTMVHVISLIYMCTAVFLTDSLLFLIVLSSIYIFVVSLFSEKLTLLDEDLLLTIRFLGVSYSKYIISKALSIFLVTMTFVFISFSWHFRIEALQYVLFSLLLLTLFCVAINLYFVSMFSHLHCGSNRILITFITVFGIIVFPLIPVLTGIFFYTGNRKWSSLVLIERKDL